MNKVWQVENNDWYLTDISGTVKALENTIYTLELNPKTGQLYLNNTGKNFEFDFKLYGLKSDFIKRAVTYYKHSKGNLGVLLNGVKGTGKTITAKVLANSLELPIILVGRKYGNLTSFFSQIDTDLIVLIDEYDKIFSDSTVKYNATLDEDQVNEDASLLSLMDGVFSNAYRRTFILTTNELWLNENMLNRPGRIRYKETFEDLEIETIEEILDDGLVYKERRNEILNYIKTLKLITVDILKSIVTEVNIFDEDPIVCCRSMNLEFIETTYAAYEVINGENFLLEKGLSVRWYEGAMAQIKRSYKNAAFNLQGTTYKLTAKPEKDKPISVQDSYDTSIKKQILFIEDEGTHKAFIPKNLTLVF